MARLGIAGRMAGCDGAQPRRPAVSFQFLLPVSGRDLLRGAAANLWPPPRRRASSKVRWKGARFVPLSGGAVDSGRQAARRESLDRGWRERMPGALRDRPGPFRTRCVRARRVDRLTGASRAPLDGLPRISPRRGIVDVVSFADDAGSAQWTDTVKAAFRLAGRFRIRRRAIARMGPLGAPEFIEGTAPRSDFAGSASGGSAGAGPRLKSKSPPHRSSMHLLLNPSPVSEPRP